MEPSSRQDSGVGGGGSGGGGGGSYDIENPPMGSPSSSLNSIDISSSSGNNKDFEDEERSTNTNISSATSDSLLSMMWTLRVMSFQNVEIQIASNSTIFQLKEVVRRALEANNSQQSLRLICKGKLLAPDNSPMTEFKIQNGDVLHAVLSKQQPQQQAATTTEVLTSNNGNRRRRRNNNNRSSSRRGRNHQVVGPGGRVTRSTSRGSAAGDDDDDSSTSSYDTGDEESSPRLGLDRLLRRRNNNANNTGNTTSVGLSRQDVAVMRTYFSRQIDRHAQTHNQHLDEPDLQRRRLLVEEDWMAVQGPTSEFRLNLNSNLLASNMLRSLAGNGRNTNGNDPFANTTGFGTRGTHIGNDRDFAWGFMLGFFVGFVMLVWVWMPTVPHKQKLGILTGISFQLALQVLNDDQEEPDEFVTRAGVGEHPNIVSPP